MQRIIITPDFSSSIKSRWKKESGEEQGKKQRKEEQEGQDHLGERIIFGPLLAGIRWA